LCLDVHTASFEVNPSIFTIPQNCARSVEKIEKGKWVLRLAGIPAIQLSERLGSQHNLSEKSESA
jgi:hypothetical protein